MKKVLGGMLHFYGLSYRKTAKLMNVSHVSVIKWRRALRNALPQPKLRERKNIAVDETKVKLGRKQIYIWCAIDCSTHELISLRASLGRSSLDALLFLRHVRRLCRGETICHVDGGPWYLWAVRKAGFVYQRTVGGLRNAAEQFFSIFKERTKRFWNVFRSWKGIDCFMIMFMGWYNLLRRC